MTTEDLELSVPDVSCGHCVKTINGALGALPGVQTVSTDLVTKRVHLRYDPDQLTKEQIETTLHDIGYSVVNGPQPTLRTSGKPLNLL